MCTLPFIRKLIALAALLSVGVAMHTPAQADADPCALTEEQVERMFSYHGSPPSDEEGRLKVAFRDAQTNLSYEAVFFVTQPEKKKAFNATEINAVLSAYHQSGGYDFESIMKKTLKDETLSIKEFVIFRESFLSSAKRCLSLVNPRLIVSSYLISDMRNF